MFTGRQQELAILNEDFDSPRSELCVVYGRRRIGKSTLLEHFARGKPAFFFTAGKEPKRLQLKRFIRELSEITGDLLTGKVRIAEWEEALAVLDRSLGFLRVKQGKHKKVLVILDEFQWMCAGAPELVSDLQRLWDKRWKDTGEIDVILCGSSISFMLGEVLSRRSPLFGRRTRSFKVDAFRLPVASKFFPGRNRYEVAEAYLAAGGVPKYLEVLGRGQSVRQALSKECFRAAGYFTDEIRFVLSEQLKETDHYFMLLNQIAQSPKGVTELEQATVIPSGQIMFYLERLQTLGFVSRHIPFGARVNSKKVRYRLDDAYLRFYFAFIQPHRERINRSPKGLSFDEATRGRWEAFAGRAFEGLARDHATTIAARLGHGNAIRTGSFWQRQTQRHAGVQIDLLIECEDKTILLCECKWGRNKTGVEAISDLRKKARLFPNLQHQTVRLVIVTAVGVTPASKRETDVAVITLDDFWRE
ncbi:MAG: AAA family ATPase [Verrucomicrobia bacterium]|nr:AAA family ATPase [Verrucomicrobiota bacterium]